MITFKQFILEDLSQLSPMIKLVRRDCQPFMKQVKGQPLYRGMKVGESKSVKLMGPFMIKGQVRQDRKPKDMNLSLHKTIDVNMRHHFGWNPRSAGLFASFTKTTAEGYGDEPPFMIFPIGPCEFLWSRNIPDVYDVFEQSFGDDYGTDGKGKMVLNYLDRAVSELGFGDGPLEDLDREQRIQVVDHVLYTWGDKLFTDKLDPHMDDKYHTHEVMVKCNSWYGISTSSLQEEFGVSPRELMEEIGHAD